MQAYASKNRPTSTYIPKSQGAARKTSQEKQNANQSMRERRVYYIQKEKDKNSDSPPQKLTEIDEIQANSPDADRDETQQKMDKFLKGVEQKHQNQLEKYKKLVMQYESIIKEKEEEIQNQFKQFNDRINEKTEELNQSSNPSIQERAMEGRGTTLWFCLRPY